MNRFSAAPKHTVCAIARDVHKRRATISLAAAALLAGMSSSVFADNAGASYTAFGNKTITVATQYPAGTVLVRDSLTPQQLCNATGLSSCPISWMALYGSNVYTKGPNMPTAVKGIAARIVVNGQPAQSFDIGTNMLYPSSPVEFQLIATGDPIVAGPMWPNYPSSNSPVTYALFTVQRGADLQPLTWYIWFVATIQTQTCSVPNQTVTLPAVNSGNFGGLGTTWGTQSFNIRLENCPAGVNRVGYSLVPVGSEVTGYAGALPLASGSTAKGVRIRVTDTNGTPVTFNTSIRLDAYNKASGGSYSVPWQASYIQTGSSVTPGSVSGSMQVLVDYQ